MEVRLFDITDGENNLIMSGDWYHDKIEEQIQGFFKALDFVNIKYEKIEENSNEEF